MFVFPVSKITPKNVHSCIDVYNNSVVTPERFCIKLLQSDQIILTTAAQTRDSDPDPNTIEPQVKF